MLASVRALLEGVLDYAGLFPPAQLPPDAAVRRYAGYRGGAEAWLLGRLVWPAARLRELAPLLPPDRPAQPFPLAGIGRGGWTGPEFLAGLTADLEDIASWQAEHGARAAVEAYEVRLPADVLLPGRPPELGPVLAEVGGRLAGVGGPAPAAYFEVSPGPDWLRSLEVLIGALSGGPRGRGCKFRCGGLEASDFPAPGDLAFVLAACRDAGVPLKFTAGLHHPVRRYDPDLRVTAHGFLNVFAAGALAHARGLSREQLLPVLADEHPANFHFDDEGFRWREWRATADEIRAARLGGVIAFGSCSFEEPRDDLRALGLLGP